MTCGKPTKGSIYHTVALDELIKFECYFSIDSIADNFVILHLGFEFLDVDGLDAMQ